VHLVGRSWRPYKYLIMALSTPGSLEWQWGSRQTISFNAFQIAVEDIILIGRC